MSETKRWDAPPEDAWSLAWTSGAVGRWTFGSETRPARTKTLEIAVPTVFFSDIQSRLEALGLKVFDIVDGQATGLALVEGPHRRIHQTWTMDPNVNGWRMDIFREPGDARTWIYRRTGELSAPRAWANGRTAGGIPYVAPQIVLFFKAKAKRDKDEADFSLVAPRLAAEARVWLANSLRAIYPGHSRIERLSD